MRAPPMIHFRARAAPSAGGLIGLGLFLALGATAVLAGLGLVGLTRSSLPPLALWLVFLVCGGATALVGYLLFAYFSIGYDITDDSIRIRWANRIEEIPVDRLSYAGPAAPLLGSVRHAWQPFGPATTLAGSALPSVGCGWSRRNRRVASSFFPRIHVTGRFPGTTRSLFGTYRDGTATTGAWHGTAGNRWQGTARRRGLDSRVPDGRGRRVGGNGARTPTRASPSVPAGSGCGRSARRLRSAAPRTCRVSHRTVRDTTRDARSPLERLGTSGSNRDTT